MSEVEANPYNARKDWHDIEETEFKSADSLFVPQKKKSAEPENPAPHSAATSQEDTRHKERYDSLKKHHDKTVTELRQEIAELRAQTAVRKPDYVPPKTPEEVSEYAKSNPELMGVIETVQHQSLEPLTKKMQEIEEREKLIAKREALAVLMERHPDFDTIKADPEFHEWAEVQPKEIREWVYNNPYNGELAAQAITLYKASVGKFSSGPDVDNAPQDVSPDAASLVPTRQSGANTSEQKKIWSRAEIKRMTPAQYDRYEADIDQAILEGRITN